MVGPDGLEPSTPRLSSACSNQLSYEPVVGKCVSRRRLVEPVGFEPGTLRVSSACSNQLSYTPVRLVELRRLELLTYSLQSYRSTN